MIYWAIALALLWTVLQDNFTLANLVGGFVLAWLVLRFMLPFYAGQPPVRWKVLPFVKLVVRFVVDLANSNLRVAALCLNPWRQPTPAILAVPLEAKSDAEIATLANLVTLTPGTLSLHVSEDRDQLYVHILFGAESEHEAVRAGVKRCEKGVLEASG